MSFSAKVMTLEFT